MATGTDPPLIFGNHRYKGIMFPNFVVDSSIDALQTFDVRASDVWIVSYPRSGTHWLMEIVGLLRSGGFPNEIDRSQHSANVCMVNMRQEFPQTRAEEAANPPDMTPYLDHVTAAPSPRTLVSHLQLRFLPPDLQKAKLIYIARNPKDVLTSFYNFRGGRPGFGLSTWEESLGNFMNGDDMRWGSWFDHVMGFWNVRHELHVLFLFYEDMKKNPEKCIRLIAEHTTLPLTEETRHRVLEHSSFTGMKATFGMLAASAGKSRKGPDYSQSVGSPFLKEGTIGRWKSHFTVAQNEAFDKWYHGKMAGTDLTFSFE